MGKRDWLKEALSIDISEDAIKIGPFKKSGEIVKCGPFEKVGELWRVGPVVKSGSQLGIGRLTISASRFPWQNGLGWFPHKAPSGEKKLSAPLNGSGARFGGGWKYKFGIEFGGTTVLVNLMFGILRVTWSKK